MKTLMSKLLLWLVLALLWLSRHVGSRWRPTWLPEIPPRHSRESSERNVYRNVFSDDPPLPPIDSYGISPGDDQLMVGQTAAPWGKSWESSRGYWTTDYNNSLTLICAAVDGVIRALADRTERWERDVLGRDIVLGEHGGAFVFRLRGHSWTEAVLELGPWTWALPAQSLSRLLKTRVIDYSVSDTSGYIGYSLYENGELLEELSVLEGDPEGPNTFSSRLRDLKRDDITNVWGFTSEFLVDQDAFDPGIDFAYFLGRWRGRVPAGDRHRIVNPGFNFMMPDGPVVTVPPIERIDYLALAALRQGQHR